MANKTKVFGIECVLDVHTGTALYTHKTEKFEVKPLSEVFEVSFDCLFLLLIHNKVIVLVNYKRNE
jgi:hypothetical protein